MFAEHPVSQASNPPPKGLGVLAVDAGGGGVETKDGKPGLPPLLDLPHAVPDGEKIQGFLRRQ